MIASEFSYYVVITIFLQDKHHLLNSVLLQQLKLKQLCEFIRKQ